MIDFSKPVRFRGIHAAYAQFLSTERGQIRTGGVNIFSRIVDAYMMSILIGLKYNRTAQIDDTEVSYDSIFGVSEENKGKKITSSDINSETIHANQNLLNYIYRVTMLTENERQISDEEKIANAFKSDSNLEKLDINIELMNSYARGGLEVLYEKFSDCVGNEDEIIERQLELFDDINILKPNDIVENNEE